MNLNSFNDTTPLIDETDLSNEVKNRKNWVHLISSGGDPVKIELWRERLLPVSLSNINEQ